MEEQMMEKRLYRSETNKMLAGICGGIGEYFNVDPTIVRLIFAVLCISGPGILFYLAALVIIPKAPQDTYR